MNIDKYAPQDAGTKAPAQYLMCKCQTHDGCLLIHLLWVQRMGEGGRTAAPGSHPLSLSKPSEVMSAVTSRFDGREKELNAATTHFNIKASEGEAGEGSAGAPDK